MQIKELLRGIRLTRDSFDLEGSTRVTITHGRERFDIGMVNLESINYGRDTPSEYTITLTTCKETQNEV